MESHILLPLIGGLLIGLSSTLMLGGLGRITGISGIVSTVISRPCKENDWRYVFIFGLLLGGIVMQIFFPQFFTYTVAVSKLKIIIAGLLVGYGTKLGSGCTSGHGVCGLSRVAKRSLVATLTFIGFGMLTVAIEGVLS